MAGKLRLFQPLLRVLYSGTFGFYPPARQPRQPASATTFHTSILSLSYLNPSIQYHTDVGGNRTSYHPHLLLFLLAAWLACAAAARAPPPATLPRTGGHHVTTDGRADFEVEEEECMSVTRFQKSEPWYIHYVTTVKSTFQKVSKEHFSESVTLGVCNKLLLEC